MSIKYDVSEQNSASRTYYLDVPVPVTVHNDGTVTVGLPDLTEATDLADVETIQYTETIPRTFTDFNSVDHYVEDETADADQVRLTDAIIAGTVRYVTTEA